MEIKKELIKKLRDETGAGVIDIKKALEESGGNEKMAIDILRKKGEKIALKKQDRKTAQGIVVSYIHANGRVGSMVMLLCETDFVARNEAFKDLAYELAMQVAAMNPLYISPEDVPEAVVNKEKEIFEEQMKNEGKPKNVIEKIIHGKLNKFYEEVCLLKQPYIKEDKKTIEVLVKEAIAKLGENIKVSKIIRFSL